MNSLLTIDEWLDKRGIDRACKKDMKATWNLIQESLVDQEAKTKKVMIEWIETNCYSYLFEEIIIGTDKWQALKEELK